MKNKLKYLALILILPVAFIFVACGQLDAEAQVNTGNEAKYEETTDVALNTYLNELDESEDEVVPSGIKLTLKFNAGDMGEGKVNVILKQTENDDGETELELAVRFEANMEMNQLEIKAKGDLYYKDDVLYMDTKVEGLDDVYGAEAELNGKHKLDMSGANGGGLMGLLGMAEYMLPLDDLNLPFSPAMLLNGLDAELLGQLMQMYDFKVSTYTDGDYTRFKLYTEDETTGDNIKAYLVFVKDVLAGVKVDAKMTQEGQEMTLALALEAFDGEINYPNFDDFAEFENMM